MLDEVMHLDKSGRMQNGKLAGGRTSGVQSEMVTNRSIRSDRIIWIQDESYCSVISSYANDTLNSLVFSLNKHRTELCFLEGHTKVRKMTIVHTSLK